MLIHAKIKTRQKKFSLEKGKVWTIAVKSPPEKGMANTEIIRELSKKYREVRIIRGLGSKKKVIFVGNEKP